MKKVTKSPRPPKKTTTAVSEEFDLDILAALQYWWSKKIQFLLTNLLIILILGTGLFVFQQSTNGSKLKYSEVVFKTTTSNTPLNLEQIIDPIVIEENLQKEQFENLDAQRIFNNLTLNQAFPQSDRIADQILGITDTQIKKLALSADQLEETIKSLNELSQEFYALRLIHNQSVITPIQAEFLLNSLIDEFNKKTSQDIDLQETGLFILNTITEVEFDNPNLLFEKLAAIRSNLTIIREQFSELVTATDFSVLTTNLNQFDKYLYQSSNLDSDEFTIRLQSKIEVIDSKLTSLYEILKIVQNNQSQQNLLSPGVGENSTIAQINNDSIQSLLSLGKELSGVDLINETAQEIKSLSFEKAELQSQLALNEKLKNNLLPSEQIKSQQINNLILQINALTKKVIEEKNPDRYLSITTPPLFYSDQAQSLEQFSKYLMVLIVLSILITFIYYILRFQFLTNKS